VTNCSQAYCRHPSGLLDPSIGDEECPDAILFVPRCLKAVDEIMGIYPLQGSRVDRSPICLNQSVEIATYEAYVFQSGKIAFEHDAKNDGFWKTLRRHNSQ
jgi:hypothetical protein